MVAGTWNSDRFWTRSRNVQSAHVRRNGETIARPREESLAIVSSFRQRFASFRTRVSISPNDFSGSGIHPIDRRIEHCKDGWTRKIEWCEMGGSDEKDEWVLRMIFLWDTHACTYIELSYVSYCWKLSPLFFVDK